MINNLEMYPDFRSLNVILDLFHNYGIDNDPRYSHAYQGLLQERQRLATFYTTPVSPNGYQEAQVKLNIMNNIYSLVQQAPQYISNAWLQMIRSHSSVVRGGY